MSNDASTSALSQIADEVVRVLNETDFQVCFKAVKEVVPDIERKALGTETNVKVVPIGLETEIINRALELEKDYTIDIGVLKAVDDLSNATVEPLIALTERIGLFWPGQNVVAVLATDTTSAINAKCMSSIVRSAYDANRLNSEFTYMGVVSLSFKFCS